MVEQRAGWRSTSRARWVARCSPSMVVTSPLRGICTAGVYPPCQEEGMCQLHPFFTGPCQVPLHYSNKESGRLRPLLTRSLSNGSVVASSGVFEASTLSLSRTNQCAQAEIWAQTAMISRVVEPDEGVSTEL
jgi:hypothetical protein